ncbi:MAG: FtsX-like permease family protein [Thermoproteota archaeon]
MRHTRIGVLLLLAFSPLFMHQSYAIPLSSISGRVIDACTGKPIQNASVIIWDLNRLEKPKIGEGIYTTDSLGNFNATYPYIVTGHSYWIYAYRGNVSAASFDYVPSKRIELPNIEPGSKNISIALVPGAPMVLYGKVWSVESPSPAYRIILSVVAPLSESAPDVCGASYVTTYGGSIDTFFLEFPSNLTVVPSGVKVELKAEGWFFVRDMGIIRQTFRIDNDRRSFLLKQGDPATLVQLADYSLRQSSDVVSTYISRITSEMDEAQRIGFYVWEERIGLSGARNDLNSAMIQLSKGNHIDSWVILRKAYASARGVHETLNFMRLVAAANAVYMPAIFSVFAVVLGFFVFENNRKKFYASILFYIVLLAILFQIYPGTKILLSENLLLFIATALISIIASLVITFGVPKVWKERDIEGQVSLRSVIPVIFSMAKRQVWRHRSRSLFAIISIVILILAFTSLTSFGTVYGLVSNKLERSSNVDAVMIRRLQPSGTQWTEIPQSDLDLLSKLFNIRSICPKVENLPIEGPIATIAISEGRMKDLYGLLGFDPELEPQYTEIEQIVVQGNFLRPGQEDDILLSRSVADTLGVKLKEEVRFVVRGRPIKSMTVIGFFDDQLLESKIDLDGQPIAPSRVVVNETPTIKRCNGTDVIIMPLQTALKLQAMAELLGAAPQFAKISRISFVPDDWQDLDSSIRTLTFAQEYTVYVSRYGSVTKFSLGFRYEAKGAAEVVVPIGMVVLNVAAVMLNAVYERRKEMQVLTLVGLNPRHIGSVFVAEAIVVGLVGGGVGYILGLGFYQIMSFFGEGLMVRPKLEWWWSAVGLGLALLASVLSALRPAMMAVTTYTPSMTRRAKISQVERERRKKEVFKVFQAVDITMPAKLLEPEVAFFTSFVLDRLREFQTGIHEMTKNIEESPSVETPEGDRIHSIKFEFYQVVPGVMMGTRNEIICIKKKGEDLYRVILKSGPVTEGIPEEFADRTIMMVRDIIMDWVKNKEKLIGTI